MSDVMRDAYCVLRNTKYEIRNTFHKPEYPPRLRRDFQLES